MGPYYLGDLEHSELKGAKELDVWVEMPTGFDNPHSI